ncbi:sigma-70 family RNA polymerase sigma factor [Acidilutibacter cellobiosedens]|jgi:RNA polymerase primary sigma factor|uniref:RNA polymerase sigma factor n=1 Tax=Acidilutibacter cellobiosedens TaxID=2507161 RepID=A0A410QDC3_9FIRM|nr:sigma-70 family RNA polymerase sigma factor [Acidilutibacter cellobiosedens]MBE6083534.1 sigma-70 family RNA polymerase sigma factor [Tissierellaceae bacterium]QAT61929.1 sigma-70 family RNA polymerase sigma factor [Acidilutibacter cellobiosedens]
MKTLNRIYEYPNVVSPSLAYKQKGGYKDFVMVNYDRLYGDVLKDTPELESFIKEVMRIVPLQPKEFDFLMEQSKNGNKYATERIFLCCLKRVIYISWNEHRKGSSELEDIIQIGSMGLYKAIKKYDFSRSLRFNSYVSLWIFKYINVHESFVRLPIHLPSRFRNLVNQALRYIDIHPYYSLPFEDNYDLVKEVAAKLDIGYEKTLLVLRYCNPPIHFEDIQENLKAVSEDEAYREVYRQLEVEELKKIFKKMFEDVLNRRESKVIRLRFGFDMDKGMTLQDVGDILGVTKERIRQIEKKAIKKLRKAAKKFKLELYE